MSRVESPGSDAQWVLSGPCRKSGRLRELSAPPPPTRCGVFADGLTPFFSHFAAVSRSNHPTISNLRLARFRGRSRGDAVERAFLCRPRHITQPPTCVRACVVAEWRQLCLQRTWSYERS